MVYGLNVKPEWGYYPAVEALDGHVELVEAIDPTPDGGVGWSTHTGGVPVDGAHFPKQVIWKDPHGNPVPDFDQTPALNVSGKAKEIIESIEPGVHQFFSVEYVDKKRCHLENRHWFVICNRIDGIDRKQTNMVLRDRIGWISPKNAVRSGLPIPDNVDPTKPAKLVFSLSQIGGAHIWSDKYLGGGSYFLSDQLADALMEAGLTGLRLAESRSWAV